jgi:hypothetical protein
MPTIYWTLDSTPEDYNTLHGFAVSLFLRGECYAFAIALNQGLGWPLVGLMAGDTVWHAGVRSPDGKIHDVRGLLTKEEFEEEFGADFLSPTFSIREITEGELHAVGPISDHSVKMARQLAEVLWPDLPWVETQAMNARAFADELEVLSRKYGLWICGGIPTQPPCLFVGDGDEYGYLVRAAATVMGTHTIGRVLHFEAELVNQRGGQK